MAAILMVCGHVANAKTNEGDPACAICAPSPEAYEPAAEAPDLVERNAVCTSCLGNLTPSRLDLPFFKPRPDTALDDYYCGCRGFD